MRQSDCWVRGLELVDNLIYQSSSWAIVTGFGDRIKIALNVRALTVLSEKKRPGSKMHVKRHKTPD